MTQPRPETVLLLHSSASSSRQWQALLEQLRGMGRLGPFTHAAQVDACIHAFIERRLPAMPLEYAALALA